MRVPIPEKFLGVYNRMLEQYSTAEMLPDPKTWRETEEAKLDQWADRVDATGWDDLHEVPMDGDSARIIASWVMVDIRKRSWKWGDPFDWMVDH